MTIVVGRNNKRVMMRKRINILAVCMVVLAMVASSDDISLIHPAESAQADFTIEGLKEGTHKIDFTINATLQGLPIGDIAIKLKNV